MAEKTMWDYLDSLTSDSSATLTVSPQEVLMEEGFKNQIVRTGDDGSEEVVTLSSKNLFYATLQFPRKNASDIGTVLDFYFDAAKGDGKSRTFRWQHVDGHVYVVRFADEIRREIMNYTQGIASIRLRILGKL
jgi:hypothetical protein